MNTNRKQVICAALAATAISAFAWSGPLSAPAFTPPGYCPQAVFDQVSAALNRRDAKFVEGHFFGARENSMSYRGDTKALNGMLADLAVCQGMHLTMGFATNLTADADWLVSTRSSSSNFLFHVQVNTRSTRVKLAELAIPALRGTALPKSSPRFKARITCFNGEIDVRSSCSGTSFQPDGTLHATGKLTCGHPGKVSEIEWAFVERHGANDVYRFTRRFPSDTAAVTTTTKEIEFSDRRVIVFEDTFQVIVMEPPMK